MTLDKSNITINIKGIICDFDGTIADTESIHNEAYLKALSEQNIYISSTKLISKYEGKTGKRMLEDIQTEGNISFDIDRVLERKIDIYNNMLDRVKMYPLVESFLTLLKDKYKLAILTVSRLESIKISLSKLQIDDWFDVLITSEDIEEGIKSSKIFLKTAKALNLKSEECLVLENSAVACTNAYKAGMKVIQADEGTLKWFEG